LRNLWVCSGWRKDLPGQLLASTQFIKHNPVLAKKVKAVYYKAVDLIDKEQKFAVRPLLQKYTGLSEAIAMKSPPKLDEGRDTHKEATQNISIFFIRGAYKRGWIPLNCIMRINSEVESLFPITVFCNLSYARLGQGIFEFELPGHLKLPAFLCRRTGSPTRCFSPGASRQQSPLALDPV